MPCGSFVNTPPAAFSPFITIIVVFVPARMIVVLVFPSLLFWLELMRPTIKYKKKNTVVLCYIFFSKSDIILAAWKSWCCASPSFFTGICLSNKLFKLLGCSVVFSFFFIGFQKRRVYSSAADNSFVRKKKTKNISHLLRWKTSILKITARTACTKSP